MIEQYKNKSRVLRFFLQNASEGIVELYNAPDGWDESGFSFSRSEYYNGVFRKYAIDKLAFVKEGRDFIKRVEDSQGFEAEIILIIWEKDYSIYSFFELFRGALKLVGKDQDRLKTSVAIIDSSFEEKLMNRDDVDIITTKRTSDEVYTDLDGVSAILGFSNEKRLITLPERVDALGSVLSAARGLNYFTNTENDPIIPILLVDSSNDDLVVGNSDSDSYKKAAGAFYVNSTTSDVEIQANGNISFKVDIREDTQDVNDVSANLYKINSNDEIVETINIDLNKTLVGSRIVSIFIIDFEINTYLFEGTIDINTSVDVNSYVQIGIFAGNNISDNFKHRGVVNIYDGVILDFSLATQTGTLPKVNVETELVHEAFARIGQKITGLNSPFYSDLFGRKNSEPRSYDYDGEDSLLAITNGALIRGFGMTSRATSSETIAPLSISLKNLFSCCSIKRPLGMGIEIIDGNKVFRIEKLSYFFDTRIALYIDDATDIVEEYNDDLIYNQLEAGYSKFESDEIRNGLYDYNTKSSWVNAITSVSNKLSIISGYSASNTSMNQARLETKEDEPTTDSKYDDQNFIIDVVENTIQNAVLNPNADQNLSYWEATEGVSTEVLIGNNKFVLDAWSNSLTTIFLSQVVGAIKTPIISFSYAVVGSISTLVTPLFNVTATIEGDVYAVKYLNSYGEWVDDYTDISLTPVKGVSKSSLQSMNKFEIAALGSLENVSSIQITFIPSFLTIESDNQYIIDDVYIADSAKYIARTSEGFDSITGIVNSNDSYNIDLTPARTLRRYGSILRAFLDDKLNTNYTFSNTEKNSTLVSKKTDEDFSVSEGQNVTVEDLDEPLWGIKKISFDALLTASQRRDINSNFDDGKPKVNALVAYRRNTSESYEYGWIDDLNLGGMDGVASLEIRPISKYVTVAEKAFAVDDGVFYIDSEGNRYIIS